jgi:hypothetical protein
MMEFIVRGATLINPERCFSADVWVKDEKFYYIHEHIPRKTMIQEIDGSEQYMLPGFFHFGSSLGNKRTSVGEFHNIQKQWIKEGFTVYVDDLSMIRTPNWRMSLGYELAMHHNSGLAYKVRLRVPYQLINESLLRAVFAHRLSMIDMIVQPSDSLQDSFWPLLLAGFSQYRIAIKLSFSEECTLREKKRWLTEHLPLLVSMLEYRAIPLVLDEHPDIVKCVFGHKQSYGAYITWEVDKSSSFSYRRKQFGTLAFPQEGIEEGRIEKALRRIVEIQSRLPARLFGLYPQKGALVAGSEADFFLIPKKFFGNGATFWNPSFVYTNGRRNRKILFSKEDTNICNAAPY